MADSRVGGSNPSSSPVITNYSESVIETEASGVPNNKSLQDLTTEAPLTKPALPKYDAAEKMYDKKAFGTFKQTELNQKLVAGKTQTKEFPPEAGNEQLDKIHVVRNRNQDIVTTQYPNGIKYKTVPYPETEITQDDENSIEALRKRLGDQQYQVEPPPGGKVSTQKDGSKTISDAKGNLIATVDSGGAMYTQTKQGKYTQYPSGTIEFEQKQNVDLASLRKKGSIDPADYESYGITENGRTIRFPNGVEVRLPDKRQSMDKVLIPSNDELSINIPTDLGKRIETRRLEDETIGQNHDGKLMVVGGPRSAEVLTEAGAFNVTRDGKISYEPKQ